jgi:hypothetical protein
MIGNRLATETDGDTHAHAHRNVATTATITRYHLPVELPISPLHHCNDSLMTDVHHSSVEYSEWME